MISYDLISHCIRQFRFSEKTFGPPDGHNPGVIDHIRKELDEIEADPSDTEEWIDVIILALDGAWRSGATPSEIAKSLEDKQTKNEKRKWPDWRTCTPGKSIEHIR